MNEIGIIVGAACILAVLLGVIAWFLDRHVSKQQQTMGSYRYLFSFFKLAILIILLYIFKIVAIAVPTLLVSWLPLNLKHVC